MKKIKLTPLQDIDPNQEFWPGTKLRELNVGMNVEDKSEDFYDYILAYANWDSGSMMIVNITENNSKAGSVYSGVIPIRTDLGKAIVTKAGFQHTLGKELYDWYLILEEYE
ncbi:hypothetical protein [uncultured Arcticibacterium sp.]|uniref:hypothetical protein n=1 Tax=uncultured Arcticibacterium sp. TaxID=2173042 RepID=UPI0030F67ADD